MHEVLVNRLGGLPRSLPRKSVVRLTDRPDMTLDVYRGCNTTIQQQQMISTVLRLLLGFGVNCQSNVDYIFHSIPGVGKQFPGLSMRLKTGVMSSYDFFFFWRDVKYEFNHSQLKK